MKKLIRGLVSPLELATAVWELFDVLIDKTGRVDVECSDDMDVEVGMPLAEGAPGILLRCK